MSQSQTSTSLRNTSFHSGGMPTGLAIHEREREEERKRRRAKAKIERQLSDSVGFPLFAEPRKVQPSSEDAIQQQIKVTLPEFETIAPALQHHNHLIGIMRLPQTPVEKKPKAVFNFDTERKDSKSTIDLTNARNGNKNKDQRHGKSSQDKKINGVVNGTGLSSGGSPHVTKMADSGSLGKSSTLLHAKSPSHSETTLSKLVPTKKLESKPVANGFLRSQHSGAKDKEKETKENVKETSEVKKKEDSHEKKANKTSVTTKSKPPKLCMPDRNLPSSSAEATKTGSWTEDKLTQVTQCFNEPANVEAIVAEMQKVAPPLTGIHTPIKGAPSVFAFHRNGVQQENSSAGPAVKRKTSENPEEKTDELLHNDLMLSDDESDNEHAHRTVSPSKPNRNGRSSLQSSSSSGSSSGESDSDSSDSDSESSCSDTNNNSRNKNSSPANSPLSSPKSSGGRNWGLGHFEKTLCPVPTAATTKTKPSPSSSNTIGGEGLRGNQAAPASNASLKSCLNSQVNNGICTTGNEVRSPSPSKSSSLPPFPKELPRSPETNHGVDIESTAGKLDPPHNPEPVTDSHGQNGLTVKLQLPKGSEKKEGKRRPSAAGSKLNANQEKSPVRKGAKLKKHDATPKGSLDTQDDHLSKMNKLVDADNKESAGKELAKSKTDTKNAGAVVTESKESLKPASEADDEDIIVDVIGDERTPLLDAVKSDNKQANKTKRKEPENTKAVKSKPSKLTNGLSSHVNGEKMFSKLVSPNRTKGPFANDVEITLNEDDKRESLIVKIDLALLKRIPKIPGSEPVHIKYPASSPPAGTNGSWNAIKSPSSTKLSKRQSSVEKMAEQESSKKSKLGNETPHLSQKKPREQFNSASSQGSKHTKDTPKKRSPIHESDGRRNKRQRHDSECTKGLEPSDHAGNHDKVLTTVDNKVGSSDRLQQCFCGDQKDSEIRDAFIATFYEPSPRVPNGPDHYLAEAKKLKHKADSLGDKESKAFLYIGSVLYFARCGKALEQNEESESRSAHQMYSETLDLLRYTMRSFVSRLNHHTDRGVDKRLAALCMRIQSILYMRLYKLRKEHVMKNVKAVTEHFKGPPKGTQAPSPYTSNAKITGTPSPLSPTPSPSGSVGSVGSVGSTGSNEAVTTPSRNGKQTSAMTSPGNVCIPQKIHSMTAQHVLQANNLLYSHDLWDQSQAIVLEQKDFFMDLDRKCRPLTLHSSIMHMIDYVEQGLKCLKETSRARKPSS